MEETGTQPINFQSELNNLSTLQAKIEETRRSLNKLSKIELSERKQIDSIAKVSMLTTRNKFNLFETHVFNKRKHQLEEEDLKARQEKVREMKEREERELREIKQQMKRNKENERLLVHNSSLQHDEMLKRNHQLELQKKEQLVKEMKRERQQFQETMLNSRLIEKQQKEVQLFNSTLAKIEKQPTLARELSKLLKEKEEMEARVQQRKEMKEKMRSQVQKLKKMKEDDLVQIIKSQSRHKLSGFDRLSPILTSRIDPLLSSVLSQPKLSNLSPNP